MLRLIHFKERAAGKGDAMSLKAIFFSLGCLLAWFVLLPLLVIGGGVTLFAYAIFAELGAFLMGNSSKTVDTSVARETARRMCGGYDVHARNLRRPAP
jgi:hypothetical protein